MIKLLKTVLINLSQWASSLHSKLLYCVATQSKVLKVQCVGLRWVKFSDGILEFIIMLFIVVGPD